MSHSPFSFLLCSPQRVLCWLFLFGAVLPGAVHGQDKGPLPPLSDEEKKFLQHVGRPPGDAADDIVDKAFGADSDEAKMPIRLHLRTRNLVLLANQLGIEGDGRLKLGRFRMVRVDEDDTPLTTMRSELGYLTLEGGPVTSLTDLAHRRIVAIESSGGVRITLDQK